MRMRTVLVAVHRYVGLVLAGFLVVAGLTGSLLAYNDELEAFVSPGLFLATPPADGAQALDPLALRELVQLQYPNALASRVPLVHVPGRSVVFMVAKVPGSADQRGAELANDQVFVDPYTGRVLGERKWGDIAQGRKNLMPFVYRLHYSLALGVVGTWVFGVVALLWTLDCFIGAWITLPVPGSGRPGRVRWWLRWLPAWKLRRGSAYKLHVDLHRAGGLWTWAMLLVLAWSSVAFNLPQVYEPAMRAVFAHQPGLASIPKLAVPRLKPGMPWTQALARARSLMAQQARAKGFEVLAEKALIYDPVRGMYRYDVKSSLDIRDQGGNTRMAMDAQTGALRGLWLPTGAATGDTASTWLANLHMATVGGWPMKLFVGAMGLVVAVLSATGVVVWARKRRARALARSRRGP